MKERVYYSVFCAKKNTQNSCETNQIFGRAKLFKICHKGLDCNDSISHNSKNIKFLYSIEYFDGLRND